MAALQDRFTNELLKDVVPHVEKQFRVKTGPENRALAGLSMGGGQTTRVLTTHPDQFGYVAIWSAGLFGGDPAAFEKQNEAFFKNAERREQVGQVARDHGRGQGLRPGRVEGPVRACSRSTASSTS